MTSRATGFSTGLFTGLFTGHFTGHFTGQCHCGAIRARLVTDTPAPKLEVRACQCSFCTRHGAMTVSDPEGRATMEITRAFLAGYRFATQTSTSLLCGRCGIYAGAMLEVGERTWSVLNVRGLAIAEFLSRTPTPVNYDGETAQSRTARRIAKWTPTDVIFT